MSLLELAAAAGRGVRDDGAPRVVTVTGAAVAATLELPDVGVPDSGELQCCVDVTSGGVEIVTMSGPGLAGRHLSAVLESAAVSIFLSSSRFTCVQQHACNSPHATGNGLLSDLISWRRAKVLQFCMLRRLFIRSTCRFLTALCIYQTVMFASVP